MNTPPPVDGVRPRAEGPAPEPLHLDEGRVLRFSLRPGQVIREACSPSGHVRITVLHGRGLSVDAAGAERPLAVGDAYVLDAHELHGVRAVDGELVFVATLQQTPPASSRRAGVERSEADAYLTWHM